MKASETKRMAGSENILAKTSNYKIYLHAYEERDILDTDEDRVMQYYNNNIPGNDRQSIPAAGSGKNSIKRSWTKK